MRQDSTTQGANMKNQFLDLGKQPIANAFLTEDQFESEYFYDLKVGFDEETKLVSLMEFVDPPLMFNENYVYHSSGSQTMCDHFSGVAENLKKNKFRRILEIGSNDGVFLKHFDADEAISVEPCGNFAEVTKEMGYQTYKLFWDMEASEIIKSEYFVDVVYAANCMCHIPNIQEAFNAVKNVLDSNTGVFVFEDPCLIDMLVRNSYDQIYDEHAHIFSLTSLDNLLNKAGMEIFDIQRIPVHGGSNRIFAKPKENKIMPIGKIVANSIHEESMMGIDSFDTYEKFSRNVQSSKDKLLEIFDGIKGLEKKIVSYGATSKSTTVFNYCGIDSKYLDYIVDTTEDKQGKFSPGTHIPVVDPSHFDESVDYAFLGAWNYFEEISRKEFEFINRGGRFITHIKDPKILRHKAKRYYAGFYGSIEEVKTIENEDFSKDKKDFAEDVVLDIDYFKIKYDGLTRCIDEGDYKKYSLLVDNPEEVSSLIDLICNDIEYTFSIEDSDVVYIKSYLQYEKDPIEELNNIKKLSPKTIILEDFTITQNKTHASLENIDNIDFKRFWFVNKIDLDSCMEGYKNTYQIPYDFMSDMNNAGVYVQTETLRYDID